MNWRRGVRWHLVHLQLVGIVPIGLFTALLLYLLPAFSGTLSYPLFVFAAGVSAVQIIIGSLMGTTSAEGNLVYATTPLRHPVLHTGPVVLISIAGHLP